MAHFEIPPQEIRVMQKKGLEMALFFDRFCQEHGLTYYFCGGCCIGTIRDGGFIPWDDDVDVFMPRKDYEKLKQLWKNTPRYSIQYPTEDFVTANQFLTICDNNTTFIKTYQKDMDINHGVVLDVLPIDGCPTGLKRKMQKLWALAYSLFVVGKAPGNHGKLVQSLGKIALVLVPSVRGRYKIWRFCEKKMSQYPIEECELITELCSGPRAMNFEYPKSCFQEPLRMRFEGEMMPLPTDYDTYLKIAFGDYMKLPPKEQQICHHEYEFMDMENSYLNYKGIYYCVEN